MSIIRNMLESPTYNNIQTYDFQREVIYVIHGQAMSSNHFYKQAIIMVDMETSFPDRIECGHWIVTYVKKKILSFKSCSERVLMILAVLVCCEYNCLNKCSLLIQKHILIKLFTIQVHTQSRNFFHFLKMFQYSHSSKFLLIKAKIAMATVISSFVV